MSRISMFIGAKNMQIGHSGWCVVVQQISFMTINYSLRFWCWYVFDEV